MPLPLVRTMNELAPVVRSNASGGKPSLAGVQSETVTVCTSSARRRLLLRQRLAAQPSGEPCRGADSETNALIPTRCVSKPVLARKSKTRWKSTATRPGELFLATLAHHLSGLLAGSKAD